MTDETPNADTLEFFMDLTGCARCHGEGHEGLLFRRLTHAFMPDGVEEAYTHWATCPKNREPILMAFYYLDPVPGETRESDSIVP